MKKLADFRPMQAWRYDPAAVSMNDVIAPPYDVISPVEQEQLYSRSPYNCVRLILNKIESSDTDQENRYSRARNCYETWRSKGILVQENAPAYYLYHQIFQDPRSGQTVQRDALLGKLHLESFDRNIVIPHEKTLSKPRADRRKLLEATATNFSPVFGLYEDPQGEIKSVISEIGRTQSLFEAVDDQGVRHTIWAIQNPSQIEIIQQAISQRKIYIADGHHRYQTALEYGIEKRQQEGLPAGQAGKLSSEMPYDFVLMALVEFNDPGLVLLPTHRMILPYKEFELPAMLESLKTYFRCEQIPFEAINAILSKDRSGQVRFGLLLEGQSYLLTLENTKEIRKKMPAGKPDIWYHLDVNVLAHFIFKLWEIDESKWESLLRFTKHEEEARQKVNAGEAKAAFLLKAPPVTVLRDMGEVHELMPQKSTYFHPKLASGLVFYSH